ncbi:hypothetical protein N7476_001883 [Penicillium atrosanguineum]|uniref:CENP-V/GFA domain-containing protein n=1 Tax=Penicillium atrosanguineum TaxID=1132637 RepID=A0A9W9U849_9EURO|nr:hypothetical protein N7476_001883 [Penicillium atrosanguineum]
MAEMDSSFGDPLPTPAVTNNPPEDTLSSEEWKHRSPYYIQSPHEFGEIKWRGHCQCRKISFSLKRDKPLNSKYCHCVGCQRMHGAPFQWAAIFHKNDISFDRGYSGLSFYSSAENSAKYHTPTKVACAYCRSPLMDEGRNTVLLFPSSIDFEGSFDEQRSLRASFKPTSHIFYEQRVMDMPDGITKWSGMDEKSQRVDDQGKPIEK